MRRGGATSLFRGTNSLDLVVLKSRWAARRTACIYVNTSLLNIAAPSITSEAEDEMSHACNLLHQEMASYHSRPKPGSFPFPKTPVS